MGQVILAWLVKHWTKVIPLLAGLALAWCVREQIRAGAKAEAYQRVAAMTAKYSQEQEKLRVETRKQMEDTVAQYQKEIVAANARVKAQSEAGGEQLARLRDHLSGEQRTLLDSVETNYRSALGSLVLSNAKLEAIIRVRTKERDDAERLLTDSHRYNDQLQKIINSERPSNGPWKALAGVATVAAVVVAIVK